MLRIFRDHLAKYFIIAALVAFVATIFFSWGMGSTQKSGGDKSNVGKINGKDLAYKDFYSFYSRTINNISKDKEVTDIEREQVLNNVWNQFVSEFVLNDFETNNNLMVTGAELFEFLKKNPPQDILQNPQFYKDGVFDTTLYVTNFLNNVDAMKQNEKYINYLEQTYKNYLLKDKISRIISGAIYPSIFEKESYIKANSELGKFEYIKVAFNNFANEEIKVSESNIKDYYKKNRDDYKIQESVNLAFIKLNKLPSKNDTAFVIKDIKSIRQQYEGNESFADLASYYSETPGADSTNGDLGYLSKNNIPFSLNTIIDSLKVGDVTKNILFGNGYYLYKLEDKKGSADSTQYKLTEIYLPIKVTPDTEDSLRDILESSKKDFSVSNVTVDTTGYFSLGTSIPKIGALTNLNSFAYNSAIGDVSEVLETPEAMFIIKVLGKKDKGFKDLNQVKDEITSILKRDSTESKAKKYAEALLPKLSTTSMDELAKADKYVMYYSNPEAKKMSDYIQSAGVNSEFHTAAFLLKDGETTKNVVTTRDGAFIIKRIFTNTIDSTQIKMLDKQYEIGFKNNTNKYVQLWFQSVEETIEIEDYRYRFF